MSLNQQASSGWLEKNTSTCEVSQVFRPCLVPFLVFFKGVFGASAGGVYDFLLKLKTCALSKPISRQPGHDAFKSLASFLYNELLTGCKVGVNTEDWGGEEQQ